MTEGRAKLVFATAGAPAPSDPPLVSVYLPTRNRSALLSRAVASVLAQDYPNLQLVIVDDCSDDGTGELVRNLIAENRTATRIVYTRLAKPSGACVARNVAIARADGELITGLDDDDYFAPGRIIRLVEAFDPSSCAFVFDGYIRKTIGRHGKVRQKIVLLRERANLCNLLRRNIIGNQVLTLTERIREIGGFGEELPAWQDYDLWIRLVRRFGVGKPVGGVSYYQTVDERIQRITTDWDKVRTAAEMFPKRHSEYIDKALASCLRLSQACYGMRSLTAQDLANIAGLRDARLFMSALFFYVYNGRIRS